MLVYFAKSCTSSISGKQLNPVTCEKCGAAFHYELARSAVGTATAPYGLNMPAAQQRAQQNARVKLAKRLARDVELVSCPHCQWVNLDLIRRFRKTVARGWNIVHLLVLFIALVTLAIIALASDDLFHHPFHWRDPAVGILLLFTACALVLTVCIQQYLRLRVNPNVHRNGLPDVPPGTPPALVYQTLPTGEIIQVAIASDYANLRTDATWATYRPGQLVFEPVCCVCLGPADKPLKIPLTVKIGALGCTGCAKRLQRCFWIWFVLLALCISLPALWLARSIQPGMDHDSNVALIITLATILLICLDFFIASRIRPYRVRVVDRKRDVRRIRFRNPAYTALLMRRIGAADGLFVTEEATR